jgi:predicted ATPase
MAETMLGDKRFLRSIRSRNLLSFGPGFPELELKSLNVLIGPNGAGKSNLIDAISLLQVMTRHGAAELQEWLKDYGLGQLWRKGEIGGNRW